MLKIKTISSINEFLKDKQQMSLTNNTKLKLSIISKKEQPNFLNKSKNQMEMCLLYRITHLLKI